MRTLQCKTDDLLTQFAPLAHVTGTVSLPLTGIALALAVGTALAAPVEFADDFSVDSLRFTVDERQDDRSERSYDLLDDRITMTVSAISDDDQGDTFLDAWGRSDSLTARVSMDSVDLPVDRDARGSIRIGGQFWNDTADGGFDGRTGDVFVQLRLQFRGDGSASAGICIDRTNDPDDNDSEGVPLFNNGDNCEDFEELVPQFGSDYTLSLSVDRAAGILTYSIDDDVRTVSLGQPVFVPASDRRSVQVTQERAPGQAVGSVYAIGNDEYFQDFASDRPVIGPYRPFFDLENGGRTLSVEDGRARFEVESEDENNERLSLQVFGETEQIEATLELSSESTLITGTGDVGEQRLQMSLGGTFYNDTAEDGFNGSEGHVFAVVDLFQAVDGELSIQYCIFRSSNEDFSDAVALLQQGEDECMDSGVAAEFDTPYPTSLTLDRDAGTLTFTAGESEFVHTIATPIFSVPEDRQFIRARARAWNGSTTIGYVDDYRTSADAPLVSSTSTSDSVITDGAEGSAVTVTSDNSDVTADSGGSSGGGCSISGRGGDGVTWALGLLAACAIGIRRKRKVLL